MASTACVHLADGGAAAVIVVSLPTMAPLIGANPARPGPPSGMPAVAVRSTAGVLQAGGTANAYGLE